MAGKSARSNEGSVPRIIAVEEHFTVPEIAEVAGLNQPERIAERLSDFTTVRLQEMDEAGIDMQVLSISAPGTHKLDAATAVRMARHANDYLHAAVRATPDRFAGLAAIPIQDPQAAADELERAVTELGLVGCVLHSMTNGQFVDTPEYWPFFERAAALRAPIYLHPARPHQSVVDAYYATYAQDYRHFTGPVWGYTVEAGTMAMRLVLSGVTRAYPDLQFILGHMGEGLPFLLWRIDWSLKRPGNRQVDFREAFCRHFHISTSGNFSDTALQCTMMEMGADRILFAIDWPFVPNRPGADWIRSVRVSEEDRAKIMSGNAERLFSIASAAKGQRSGGS
jgi:2,3-dihydroxybenzoate decarboxylase